MSKVVRCELHRCYEDADDLIDFEVSPDWGRFYAGKGMTPPYPDWDDRPELVRRIDEGVAQAMRNIESDMNGESPADVSTPNYERQIETHSARLDYNQSGKPIIEKSKKQSSTTEGGIEI